MKDSETLEQRLGAMAAILVISLFAVSFPAISQWSKRISIPRILFFVGKHFGTGVILSTAFCHLLQDAFESLTNPEVKQTYPRVGSQTGFIILGALIVIFLIEYISTSYVDYLHEDPSAPPSSADSPIHSRSQSPTPTQSLVLSAPPSETTPLLQASPTHSAASSDCSVHSTHDHSTNRRPNPSHSSHISPQTSHPPHPTLNSRLQQHYLSSILTNNPRHSRSSDSFYIINDLKDHLNNGEYQLVTSGTGKGNCVCVCVCPAGSGSTSSAGVDDGGILGERGRKKRSKLIVRSPSRDHHHRRTDSGATSSSSNSHVSSHHHRASIARVGRQRQVVGILVLQLGIMIHSFVIGLTLAITSGSEFTTLVTAIVFHQLFEGLSLGIRIAALPPPVPRHPLSLEDSVDSELDADLEAHEISETRSGSGGNLLPTHRSKFGSSSTTALAPAKPNADDERLESKRSWLCFGRRRESKETGKTRRGETKKGRNRAWLQPLLSFLFAITTPVGMGLGMVLFGSSKKAQPDQTQMLLTQGLMCAISAGMLIYAATVEMIAGDFVFGNLGGGGHGHGHSHGEELFEGQGDGGEGEGAGEAAEHVTPTKKVFAVGSMLAGVVAMGLIGLGE
ncbi:Zip-domain-containing protein [Dendrothele bispora CBS 962.96]|uniref:Zip-domain-containing protein n=1 Tax=Dendrothele bispora (strain CBS 962.96) TaxID=1314807 RepID=A0A4S8MH99_DENBC|nr:Zip-domain-containing protein [Dendrothele bispora CBS 962.96]